MYIRPGLYSRTWHWRFPPQCSHSVWLLAFGPYHTFFTQLAMHRITDLISPAHPIDIQFYFYHINFFLFKKGGKGSIIQGFTPHESKLRLTGEGNEVEVWKLSDKTKILRWQPRGVTPLRSLYSISALHVVHQSRPHHVWCRFENCEEDRWWRVMLTWPSPGGVRNLPNRPEIPSR